MKKHIENIYINKNLPLVLLGGVYVYETLNFILDVYGNHVPIYRKLDIPYVFKASFDKASWSSIHSFYSPGLNEELRIFENIKAEFNVHIITDVHEFWHVVLVAEAADLFWLQSFLAHQTDLVVALANTCKTINIKTPQSLSPSQVKIFVEKFLELSNSRQIICDGGKCFGSATLW